MDIKKLIEEQYDNLGSEEFQDVLEAKFTTTMKAETKFMLDEIANKFKVSTTGLSGEILDEAVMEMFWALTEADRQDLAIKADVATRDYVKKKGLSVGLNVDTSPSTRWSYYLDPNSEPEFYLQERLHNENQGDK